MLNVSNSWYRFDNVKLAIFLYIKPPGDEVFIDIVPEVWWQTPETLHQELNEGEVKRKVAYQESCQRLRETVAGE